LYRYRQACDYLAAAMIYLKDNVLLREPLRAEHLKPRLLGHWGTCPGINLVYSGLNRLVRESGQRTLFVCGPGHGAPAVHANLWLEGTHADFDGALARNGAGVAELVRRFSWPGGFPSHLSPAVPGVIHEGGELGYALATAFGAAMDNPDLLVACLVGDGEAETGPTAAAWQAGKYLDPATGGIVLPILHVNGYKISSPTIYGSMSDEEICDFLRGSGWSPIVVTISGQEHADERFAVALDSAYEQATKMRKQAGPVRWPAIVLRSPKGMGVPDAKPDGTPLAGTFHAHQVPLEAVHEDPAELRLLEEWLRSYGPDELFDDDGRPMPELLAVPPAGDLRMGAVPDANGGRRRQVLPLPEMSKSAIDVPSAGAMSASATGTLAPWLGNLVDATNARRDFRIFCPDELESNRLGDVLSKTTRGFVWPTGYAEKLSADGRVTEVLSEHLCQGFLQGYLLTGRHGLFPCYEAFASIVDSMVNQYAKFLKMSAEVPWRAPVSSLTYLLTSEGWRQEHNGYSHQGPGFINNLLTKKASVARIYLPPDANTLLVTMNRCLSSTDRINLVVAGKNETPQWLDFEAAVRHCRAGAAVWPWACHDGTATANPERPDVVLAAAGNIPTVEVLAAADLLRTAVPDLRLRVVNVVDLLSLVPPGRHPHGMTDADFSRCFPEDVPVVFGFHGYPSAVHEVLHGRGHQSRFHVHGYLEEGTTTTPFDLLVSNNMSRYDLAADAIRQARGWASTGAGAAEQLLADRDRLREYAYTNGKDSPEFDNWKWPG
jgi:xylulose-5-phosphate/fructose-6-phosphate phosphoketolase